MTVTRSPRLLIDCIGQPQEMVATGEGAVSVAVLVCGIILGYEASVDWSVHRSDRLHWQ